MKILIIGNRGNLQKFLKLKEINLSTETNLTNLYVHYENDKYYICVTVNPYSVIELKLGLNISQKIILLLDREKDDENELITLLRKVKEDLKDKIIITCALGEDLKGIDSTYKKIQSILEDTILLDTVNLLDNEILNDLYLDDKDSNNESFDTKEIILNQLTHAGLGKGYEVLKLDNEVERMELLTQKSIYIGCLHSNNSYFISKDDNNLDSEIPVLISRNNERLNLIMVNPQNTESTNEDDILTFNLYSND